MAILRTSDTFSVLHTLPVEELKALTQEIGLQASTFPARQASSVTQASYKAETPHAHNERHKME